MFLTRIGFGSKAVVNGDSTQTDLQSGQASGLAVVQEILDGIEGIEFCHLGARDVVRHKIVQDIVEAYRRLRRAARRGGRRTSVTAMSDDDGSHPAVLISNRQSDRRSTRTASRARATRRSAARARRPRRALGVVRRRDRDGGPPRRDTWTRRARPTCCRSRSTRSTTAGVRLLGDVIVAPSVAARNNPDDPAGEVRLLLVHGILHVLGLRPRGRRGARGDVGATGALQRGAGAVNWLWVLGDRLRVPRVACWPSPKSR